ncbi:hypothetical protein [Streptosporangium sp. NPDC051022]|uniref:hypothetical protein n=1 Tax=Streptosporangium sp. NPDC051022 TaxID=3155752 RepID=UPI0034309A43
MSAMRGSKGRPSPSGDEAVMDAQGKALIVVQRLLRKQGIRARRDHTISLGLFANRVDTVRHPGGPPLRSWLTHCPPVLVVTGEGRRGVTVTMGPGADCYVISLPDVSESLSVDREQPGQVVDLIVAAGTTATA